MSVFIHFFGLRFFNNGSWKFNSCVHVNTQMSTHRRRLEYFILSCSDQYCISLQGEGLAVVQENSIHLCIKSKKPFPLYLQGSERELLHTVRGQCSILKGRRQIYPACLKHYKPVSHGDSLNYESALDKFSSVCSFKETTLPPLSLSPKGISEEGEEQWFKGWLQFSCVLVFLVRSVAVEIRKVTQD